MRAQAKAHGAAQVKKLRPGLLALASLGLLLVLAGIGTFLVSLQTSSEFGERKSRQEGKAESPDWVKVRASDARHGERVIAKIIERAERDPIYKQTILRTTKQDIWSLHSLTEDEKSALWDRSSRVQNRLRRLGMEDSK